MKNRSIVDVHAHVLPGVDDGARDLEEACFLLDQAASQGIRIVIATPHVSGRNGPEGLEELAGKVQQEIRKQHPEFTLYLGQEAFFHEELPRRLKAGSVLTIAGSRYVLTEFDPEVSFGSLTRGIRALSMAGFQPVLAHMERYQCLRQEENLSEIANGGCLCQMNYSSLQGSRFHSDVRWCRRQVLDGNVHLLGTDMHRMDFRPPDIKGAMEWLEGHVEEELLDAMIWKNAMNMLRQKETDFKV